jgi:hypothetical protein
MSLNDMLLPALLMYINGTFSTILDIGSDTLAANRILHGLLPLSIFFSFLLSSLESKLASFVSLESVT